MPSIKKIPRFFKYLLNKSQSSIFRRQARIVTQYYYIAIALCFASWVIYIQHGWVTIDSILYFEMARHFADGNLQAAYQVEGYSWGLYPALIAFIHGLTGLGLQASGNVLIVLSFVMLTLGLVRLVKLLGGGWKEQALAVFMLLGARYISGDILPMASRDLIYWATMLWAVNFLIAYYLHGEKKHAWYWQCIAITAMLFRIEGAVQLLVLPVFGILFTTSANTWKARLLPYALLILAIILFTPMLLIKGLSASDLGRINEFYTGFRDIQSNFSINLTHRVDIMREQVIGHPFRDYAWASFLLSYFYIVTAKCLTVAGWAPSILSVVKRETVQQTTKLMVRRFAYYWLLSYWLIGCLIAFKVNLLSSRYVAIFGLVLIALASFPYAQLIQHYKQRKLTTKSKALLWLCSIIIAVGLLGSAWPKRAYHFYEIDAVQYVEIKRAPSQRVLYSSPRQRFYAQAPYQGRTHDEWSVIMQHIQHGTINQYDWLLIELKGNDQEIVERAAYLAKHLTQHKLVKVFYGYKHKKRVLVYEHLKPLKDSK